MAVTCGIETGSGIALPAAYVKIGVLNVTAGLVRGEAAIWAGQAERGAGKAFLETMIFTFVPDTGAKAAEIFTQAYAALKALPRFAGAVDA